MKVREFLFERTAGHWLFWCSAIYLALGIYCALYYKEIPAEAVQGIWILMLGSPLVFPPLGRWLNMSIDWDKKMFNWFGKKDYNNVVKFPEQKTELEVVTPEKKEEPARIYYRLGLTDNNRVAFQMGYNEITMSAEGVQNMIDQLKFFQSQLREESGE